MKVTNEMKEDVLRHMLGADSRYKKSQRGFRNHFCAGKGHHDMATLEELEGDGRVIRRKPCALFGDDVVFNATKEGCEFIGLHKAAIKRALSE